MKKLIRKTVESIYIDNLKDLQKALRSLLETPEGQDYVIVILKEAIDNGRLLPCGKTAAIISGIIAEMSPCREILTAIAEGVNDPIVCQDPNWINDIIFKDTGIKPEARRAFWERLYRVKEVKQLFADAPITNAIDERCTPITEKKKTETEPVTDKLRVSTSHANGDSTADTVDAYGYAYVSSTPTVDELCGDESCDGPGDSQHRPDPVPSDWKIDDTCTGSNTTSADSGDTTSTAGAPPDANTDVLPEDAVNDEWPPKGDQGKFYSEGREVYFI